jgi:hypothetical protein
VDDDGHDDDDDDRFVFLGYARVTHGLHPGYTLGTRVTHGLHQRYARVTPG